MGEIADLMIEGEICEGCGAELGGGAPGFPRRCAGCGGRAEEAQHEYDGEEDDPPPVDYAALKEAQRAKRQSNTQQSTALLQSRGIAFETKNRGAHLIVRHAGRVVDFWPSGGRFIEREGAKAQGRGVFNLLKALEARQS